MTHGIGWTLRILFGGAIVAVTSSIASAQQPASDPAAPVAPVAPPPTAPATSPSGVAQPAPAQPPATQNHIYVHQAPPAYGQPVYAQPYAQPRPRVYRVPYEEGMPVPEGGQIISKTRPGLWVPGLGLFLATYGLTALSGSIIADVAEHRDRTERERAARYLYIPVLGPFLFIPHSGPGGETLLVFDGLLQAGGIALFVVGLTMKRQFLVYMAEGPRGRRFALAPAAAPGGVGLELTF